MKVTEVPKAEDLPGLWVRLVELALQRRAGCERALARPAFNRAPSRYQIIGKYASVPIFSSRHEINVTLRDMREQRLAAGLNA